MQYLFVICGVFSLLFSLLLFTRKSKEYEHWFLAFMFLLITVNCAFVFAFSASEELYYVRIFSELNYAIPLLYGPLFLYYTKALTTKEFKLTSWDYVHYLPFFVFFLVILVPVFTTFKLPDNNQLGYPLIKLITAPFYLIAVIILIRSYHKRFLEQYSYEQEVNLIWLNWIITGAIILWVIATASYLYNLFNDEAKILLYDYYTLSFLAVFLFGLAFVAFKKTDLFTSRKNSDAQLLAKLEPESSAQQEEVTPPHNELEIDLKKLETVMIEQEPYLDPLLSLNKLAAISGIPSYRLTKVLKQALQSNFYDYVNRFRVENVKKLLGEGQAESFSILGIASESGFNSKASFNRIFKKLTGMTPTAYLKSIS